MPTPRAEAVPSLVNYTVFADDPADIRHTFTPSLPTGPWTAKITHPNADDIDLDVTEDGDALILSFPTLTAYAQRQQNRLRLMQDGISVIEGPVALPRRGSDRHTTNVAVTVSDSTVVAVSVDGIVSTATLLAALANLPDVDGGTPGDDIDLISDGGLIS